MSKIKTMIVVVGAVAMLNVLGASSASATWLINGTSLTGTQTAALSPQALVDAFTIALVPALNLQIQCSGHFLDGLEPQIFGSDKVSAKALTFLGCNTISPKTGCALAETNQPISTNPILALAAKGKGEAVNATFKPETKTTFTNINFSEEKTETCAFTGLEPVAGAFVLGAPTGQLSLLAQALTGLGSTEGNNSLLIDGDRVFLLGGSALLTLASDSKWSFD